MKYQPLHDIQYDAWFYARHGWYWDTELAADGTPAREPTCPWWLRKQWRRHCWVWWYTLCRYAEQTVCALFGHKRIVVPGTDGDAENGPCTPDSYCPRCGYDW